MDFALAIPGVNTWLNNTAVLPFANFHPSVR